MTKMFIDVQGKGRTRSFYFDGDRKYLQQWWDEGLDVYVILNEIPPWIVDIGLRDIWIKIQDFFCLEKDSKNND